MVRSAWLRSAGPGLVALVAVGVLASTSLGARERPWDPPACGSAPASDPSALGPVGTSRASGPEPWFRLDPVLDVDGALVGQRLIVGRTDGTGRRFLDLPPESAVTGPIDRTLVVTADDGAVSRVVALDVVAGCATTLDVAADVIRRATIALDGRTLVEARVDRRTRADRGIWRRELDGRSPTTPWIDPIGADERFGRTWSTDLVWSTAGTELAIQSCGEVACRTRIVDPTAGDVELLDDPAIGPTIGLADGRLVAYLACRGTPCPIVAIDVGTGDRRILVPEAGPAVLIATDDGARLVHRTGPEPDRILRSVALDGSDARTLGPVPAGLDLLAEPAWSGAGAGRPAGWVVLAPAGRMPRDPAAAVPLLRHAIDGRSAALDEVSR